MALSREFQLKSLVITAMLGSGVFGACCFGNIPKWQTAIFASLGLVSVAGGTPAAVELWRDRPRRYARKEALKEHAIRTEIGNVFGAMPQCEPGASPQDCDCVEESGWKAPQNQSTPEQLKLYDFADLPDENTGIAIYGNAGSGKTSVCCAVLGILTQQQPAIIEVLDPHGGINKIWGEMGLPVLCEYEEIEARLKAAIAELDARRQRAKDGESIGDPYIFVCDELDSCYEQFGDAELISKAVRRLGKEGRKYDLSLVFISHTSNVGKKGFDAQERNCYVNIMLGGSAHAVAKYSYRKDELENLFLKQQAYPCLVSSGGLPPIPAIHPTHGTYAKFKKKGNPPKNLLPINQINPCEPTQTNGVNTQPTQNQSHSLESLFRKDLRHVTRPTQPSEINWENGQNDPVLRGCVREYVMLGISKSKAAQMLGISRGSKNTKYDILCSLYDEFTSMQ